MAVIVCRCVAVAVIMCWSRVAVSVVVGCRWGVVAVVGGRTIVSVVRWGVQSVVLADASPVGRWCFVGRSTVLCRFAPRRSDKGHRAYRVTEHLKGEKYLF